VADDIAKSPSPFDVRTVKALVALMTQHDLNEIDLRDGPQRLRLRRGANQTVVTSLAPAPIQMPVPAAAAPPSRNDAPAAAKPGKHLLEIKSETVGTFYASANPESQPFVRIGSKVTPTTVVCLIEAMKLFNEIQAGCSGSIAEILVENQQAVEFGQVLFRVDPQG
jgi:acetyl-CoA carboxylase biotin carboxyl carrier protein